MLAQQYGLACVHSVQYTQAVALGADDEVGVDLPEANDEPVDMEPSEAGRTSEGSRGLGFLLRISGTICNHPVCARELGTDHAVFLLAAAAPRNHQGRDNGQEKPLNRRFS